MITKLSRHEFVDAFDQMGRGNQFSRAARCALFDYYEQLEDDLGETIGFGCIAICCDWSEYSNALEWAGDYGYHPASWIADRETFNESLRKEMSLDYLKDNTQVIDFRGGILVQSF